MIKKLIHCDERIPDANRHLQIYQKNAFKEVTIERAELAARAAAIEAATRNREQDKQV